MAAVRLSPALRFWWFVHRWLYRLSGGRIGTKVNGFEILLLTTRGRTAASRGGLRSSRSSTAMAGR